MSVAIMVIWYVEFSLATYIYCLRVKLMQIEQESQVIVHKFVSGIKLDAFPPVFNSRVV